MAKVLAGVRSQRGGGKALVNELNLGVDDRTNSIIMSGDPDTVDLAERMIADLDKDVENFVTDVKIIRLKHASIDQVLPMLQSVFNENSNDPSREGISRQVTRLRLHLQGEGVTVSEAPAVRDTLTIQGMTDPTPSSLPRGRICCR